MPIKFHKFLYLHKTSSPSSSQPWVVPPPFPTALQGDLGHSCAIGWYNDRGTLTFRSEQGPGMQNTLQHRGQCHTTKDCPPQNTSSPAVRRLEEQDRDHFFYDLSRASQGTLQKSSNSTNITNFMPSRCKNKRNFFI